MSTPVGLVDALTVSLVVGEPLSLAMASVSASSTSVVSSPSCAWLLGSAGVAAPRASGRLRGRGIDDVGVGVDCDSQPRHALSTQTIAALISLTAQSTPELPQQKERGPKGLTARGVGLAEVDVRAKPNRSLSPPTNVSSGSQFSDAN